MPPPVRIRGRATAWPAYELDALNRAEIAGASDDEIRALVRELLARRKTLLFPIEQVAS
jgi:prophage regulatory protein